MNNTIDDDELRALLPSLRRFALWLSRDAAEADDLVQASLERALSRWSTRRGDGSLKAWLFAILHRQFLDQRRRAGRWRNVLAMLGGDPGAVPSAEETFVARSSLEAFGALAVDHRAVLLLVVVEGLPYQDAAQALGVPVGTVMSRLSRARAAYRKLTGDEPGGARLRRIG
ncbi:sigma-70 family RNA polymerase sigma factor [Luteimonas soli]|uniref:Sigma-70 family RNA polymerase sigma factor n=1 Tax=Luteimonas soli TaxID=1648966 RepID=A0ABV7XIX1_9GAMM